MEINKEDCIRIAGRVQLFNQPDGNMEGEIMFNRYRWKFTSSNLFNTEASFDLVVKRIGTRRVWFDQISIPEPKETENGFETWTDITYLLAEMIATAFNRHESAYSEAERLLEVECERITSYGSSVDVTIWVHPTFLKIKKVKSKKVA